MHGNASNKGAQEEKLMVIRNYVGARYVPKFADPVEWQANTSYEAMVIVTYNNSSYTSKVPVPPTVGNPAENSTYWALTGNYNAQVEQYRRETIQFKNEIKTSEEAYKNEITEDQNNFQSTLTSNYSDLKQEVNNLTLSAGNPQATSAEITAARGAYSTLSERLNNSVSVFPSTKCISSENYKTYLTDANAAIPNNIYRIAIHQSSREFPANLPVTTDNGKYGHGSLCYLLTLINKKMGDDICDIQIFYDVHNSKIWSRVHNLNGTVNWAEWKTMFDGPRKIMHIEPDDNFAQKIIMAYEDNYTEVHVDSGTYNVQDNLKALYGSLENQYNNNKYRTGLPIGKGIKYIFDSNAVVTLNYTGTDQNVEATLSLFAAYDGNYELHGGTFITNNIKYTISDVVSDIGNYYHEYDGCRLEHTSNSGSKGYVYAIGGGLGVYGTIYIHDCYFKSITNKSNKASAVAYRNSYNANCKSRVVIRDNYFDLDNNLRLLWCGPSELITQCLVSNNSFGSDIAYEATTSDSTYVNMEYKAWNNEVRT